MTVWSAQLSELTFKLGLLEKLLVWQLVGGDCISQAILYMSCKISEVCDEGRGYKTLKTWKVIGDYFNFAYTHLNLLSANFVDK